MQALFRYKRSDPVLKLNLCGTMPPPNVNP